MFPSPLFGLLARKTGRIDLKMPYAVVVPARNKEDTLKKCVDAIFCQTIPPKEVFVINDYSTDKTGAVLHKLGEKYGITIIDHPAQMGRAVALNSGLEKVTTQLVLLLDADTYLAPDYCEKLMRGFTADVVGAVGKLRSASTATFTQKARDIEFLVTQRMVKSIEVKIGGLFNMSGAATMWKTGWLRSIGGVPPNTSHDDMLLTWFAQIYTSANYVDEAVCWTEDPETIRAYIRQIYRWYSWRPLLSWSLFKKLKSGLKFTISWILLDAISSFAFLLLLLYILIFQYSWQLPVIALSIDYIIYGSVACYEGWRAGNFKKTLNGLPDNAVLRYVNVVVFALALVYPMRKSGKY